MAFNFPASVAACLAAAQGFKVPRQLAMYCIAQDAGAPYMLYKDNMDRNGGGAGGMPPMAMLPSQGGVGGLANGVGGGHPWGGGPPSVEASSYPVAGTPASPTADSLIQQNGDSPHSLIQQNGDSPHSLIQQNVGSPQSASVTVTVQTNQDQQSHSLSPPVQSPAYQQSAAEQAGQQGINGNQQVNGTDDETVGQTQQPQHPQQTSTPHSPALQASDPADHPTSERPSVCFGGGDTPYYRNGGGGAPPPPPPHHMLTTNSFMTYLKQQHQHQQQQQQQNQHSQHNQHGQHNQQGVVMLTQLQAADPGADFAASMPDLLAAQQNNSKIVSKGNQHTDLRLFKCVTCGKDFKQKSTLLQHERIHTDSRPYPCAECGKRFRQQSHLTQHLRIHANEKPFACVYCERTFRQRAILNQHLRIHSGEKPFACTQCGKRFRQKAILNQHVRTHQDVSPHLVYKNGQLWPQDLPFPSSDKEVGVYDQNGENCFSPDNAIQFPAYFKDSKGMSHGVFGQGKVLPDLIQHGRSAGMPLYVRCPICQKEFKQKSTLLQHGCIHIESRPYPCGECGKRFRQQSHLTQHLRIHTNEKPYACVYCGRNFRQRTILNQHVRIHTGEKPYRCGQCGKDFRQKAILDQHTRTHQSDRPYCCPMPNCRRRFATEHEVKRHIDNHMNPHASKRRTAEVKHRPPSPLSPMQPLPPPPTIKPELYFPQCYVSTATPSPSPFSTQHSPSPFNNQQHQAYSASPHPQAITPPTPVQQQDFKPPTQLTAAVVQ